MLPAAGSCWSVEVIERRRDEELRGRQGVGPRALSAPLFRLTVSSLERSAPLEREGNRSGGWFPFPRLE